MLSLFLPEGYPESVPPDYLPYQFWDSIQALCSYVRGILTAEAILLGAGFTETKVGTSRESSGVYCLRDPQAGVLMSAFCASRPGMPTAWSFSSFFVISVAC